MNIKQNEEFGSLRKKISAPTCIGGVAALRMLTAQKAR
jgi:hypothetical protein